MTEATIALCSHHERVLEARTRLPVPVLLVSGSLGSGKTALLNHLLRNRLNLRVTCLVNDLAALNVDATLLLDHRAAHKTVALSDGCVCHGLRGDFEKELWKVLQETDGGDRVDYFIIETSGVADPLLLVSMLERRFGKMTRARLDALVIVVDADLLAREMREQMRCHELADGHSGLEANGQEGPEANGLGGPEVEAQPRLEAAVPEGQQAGSSGQEATPASEVAAAAACMPAAAGESLWHQLRRADLIVLNKRDLLSPADAALLPAAVRLAAPWADVVATEWCNVPLCQLLNVEMTGTAGGGGGMPSHEAEQRAYITRPHPPSHSRPPVAPYEQESVSPLSQPHADFSTIEFSSSMPLRLAAFQDIIATIGAPQSGWPTDGRPAKPISALTPHAWRRVRRLKGVVWFAECRSLRWVLQLSGRQRVELRCDGVWEGRPAVQLVAIGQQPWAAAGEALRSALHRAREPDATALTTAIPVGGEADVCLPCDADEQARRAEAAAVASRLRACGRFEVLEPPDAGSKGRKRAREAGEDGAGLDCPDSCLVHFQLVGASAFGISRRELESRHRVNVDSLTEQFVTALNFSLGAAAAAQPKPLLTGARGAHSDAPPAAAGWRGSGAAGDPRGAFTARFAVGGACSFDAMWPLISQVADEVISRELAHVRTCRCDV
jgi:G3E family GTPase